MSTQEEKERLDLLQGTVDVLILKTLSWQPMHGYSIARWIEQRMAQPGSVLIAVGAGHLAGPYSVLELLKRDGYKVRRIE